MSSDAGWSRLYAGVQELCELFPDGVVFIGGIAVLLHVRQARLPAQFAELSHDGDFLISLSDFADLRDLEEVTANRRLEKHQIIKNGFEYDVYLENHNRLRVRFADAFRESTVVDGVRVASLEHLVLLKLDAWRSRRGSSKGSKDERDLLKICYLLATTGLDDSQLLGNLTAEDASLLDLCRTSPEVLDLCGGNAHEARDVRARIAGALDRLSGLARP